MTTFMSHLQLRSDRTALFHSASLEIISADIHEFQVLATPSYRARCSTKWNLEITVYGPYQEPEISPNDETMQNVIFFSK